MLYYERKSMEKIYNIRKATLLLLALTSNSFLNGFGSEPFFAPFQELFAEMDLAYSQPTKSLKEAEEDLKSRVARLQEEAKRLSNAANELAKRLETKDSKSLPDITAVDESCLALNSALHNVKREMQIVNRVRNFDGTKQSPACSLRTKTDDKNNLFIITANLPGIAKEDLKITVKTSDDFGVERQTLLVTAEPKEVKDLSTGSFKRSSTTQSRYINGRREELTSADGSITITVDLPKDTSNDLAEVQKTMTFENNSLVLSFPMSTKGKRKETELRFASSQKTPFSEKDPIETKLK